MAQAAQNQPPDPAMLAFQLESTKLQLEGQKAEAEAQLQGRKLGMEDDRERDRMAREFALREKEMELKYGTEVSSEVDAETAQNRADG